MHLRQIRQMIAELVRKLLGRDRKRPSSKLSKDHPDVIEVKRTNRPGANSLVGARHPTEG